MYDKITKSICCFTKNPSDKTLEKLSEINDLPEKNNYEVQTKRICASGVNP